MKKTAVSGLETGNGRVSGILRKSAVAGLLFQPSMGLRKRVSPTQCPFLLLVQLTAARLFTHLADPEKLSCEGHGAAGWRLLREELDRADIQAVLGLTGEQRRNFDAWSSSQLRELAAEFDIDTTGSQKRMLRGMLVASTLALPENCRPLKGFSGVIGMAF